MNNDGVIGGNKVAKLAPEQTVTKLEPDDRLRLNRDQFERLSSACFDEIARRLIAA